MPADDPAAVRIRMYGTGVGDCFLVTLPGESGGCGGLQAFHVLIDCGTVGTDSAATELIKRVAQDIDRETGGRLDVVVATHPMWDHVGGFLLARDVFERMTIAEVWLAWTESPGEDAPGILRERRASAFRGLRAAARQVAARHNDDRRAGQLRGMLDLLRAGPGLDARDALKFLAAHPSRPRVFYHRPGRTPVPLGSQVARAYVLGPSTDVAVLRGGPGQGDHAFASAAAFFAAAVGDGSPDDADAAERRHAFEQRYRSPADDTEGYAQIRSRYEGHGERWRRIEADWLNAARQFALELDAHLNNSSLALAIELRPGGDVLLFPGDAQSPTWRTWGAKGWCTDGPNGPRVTLADLLPRTVLYKVSHHGGPSGTPLRDGLDRMTDRRLIAMVPVAPSAAKQLGWKLPAPALLDQLRRRTGGRVVLADGAVPLTPPGVSATEWAAFARQVVARPDGLFTDFILSAG